MQNKKPGTKNRRPVKLLRTSSFLKCLEQTTVEFVTKKPSFPCCRYIRLHHRLLCLASLGIYGRNENVSVSLLLHKLHSNIRKRHIASLFFQQKQQSYSECRQRRPFASKSVKNNLETSKLTEISLRVTTRVNLSLVVVLARLLFQYGAENCKKVY